MLEILQYQFFQKALLAGLLVAILSPLIGMYVVVRRYSALSDTLSHVALVGVAVGLITSVSPIFLGIVFSVIAGVLIELLRSYKKVYTESALMLFLSGSIAVVSILISSFGGFRVSLSSFLFGSITTVTDTDLYWILGIFCLVIIMVSWFYKGFLQLSFSEDLAKISGVNVFWLRLLITVLASMVVAIGIQIVGGLLIGSLMVIPVITSLQYKLGFRASHILAVAISVVALFVGFLAAFYYDIPTGGAIVLTNITFFVISLGINWRR